MKQFTWIAALILGLSAPALAEHHVEPTPRSVVERAVEAHGGDLWLEPGTLALSGTATFFDPATGAVRVVADDYRMWREMDADRTSAHGASGKVRIIAKAGERLIFEVGYDGETTWTERGIMPREQADAYWATNFGFGIVRQALDEGFTLAFAPSRDIRARATDLVRITDPQGAETLFGFDRESGFITYLAFDTPRGFHERLYADFVKLDNGWVQAREVTLLYGGIMSNRVLWSETAVGEPIDQALFTPPAN
ncbi:MAG: hypothetical protein AAF697_03210 [Pseudomonadota bacterium]